MSYQLAILRRAVKELSDIPEQDRHRIQADIRALAENPRPVGIKKLVGRDGYRIRSGHYRVIFDVSDSTRTVTILHVGHRKNVYD